MIEPYAPEASRHPNGWKGFYQRVIHMRSRYTGPGASKATQGFYQGWRAVLVLLAVVFVLPALLVRHAPEVSFDDSRRKALVTNQPDYVFIGNSMVFSRIDHETLTRELGGKKGMDLTMGGVFTAHWYLWLKNELIASGIRPKTTFIFFRQDSLTNPYRSVSTPEDRILLAQASVGREEELERVLAFHRPFLDWVEMFFYTLYPMQLKRTDVDWVLDSLALLPSMPNYFSTIWRAKISGPPLTQKERDRVQVERQNFKREIKDTLFDPNGFRDRSDGGRTSVDSVSQDAGRSDFASQLPNSLLPAMIRLGQEEGLKLVFVMVKPRPAPDGHLVRLPHEERYVAELRNYLTSNGIGFHDDFYDATLTHRHYQDQWHIAPPFKPMYTRRFVENLKGLF
ncbi:MAG: hypothetical protein HQL94_04370 [Magnetococcales bacterium]|nr:hypothetical protein [Magnetococcales bacterium]